MALGSGGEVSTTPTTYIGKSAADERRRTNQHMGNFQAQLPKSSVVACFSGLRHMMESGLRTDSGLFPSSLDAERRQMERLLTQHGKLKSTSRMRSLAIPRNEQVKHLHQVSGVMGSQTARETIRSVHLLPRRPASATNARQRARLHLKTGPESSRRQNQGSGHQGSKAHQPPSLAKVQYPRESLTERAHRVKCKREELLRQEHATHIITINRAEVRSNEAQGRDREIQMQTLALLTWSLGYGARTLHRRWLWWMGMTQARVVHEINARVLQRAWHAYFSRRMLRLLLSCRKLKMFIEIRARIIRKRRAASLLIDVLNTTRGGPNKIIKKYLIKIRKCQHRVRAWINCRRARYILLLLNWEKLETQVRAEIAAEQRAERQRIATQRAIDTVASEEDRRRDRKWRVIRGHVRMLDMRIQRIGLRMAKMRTHGAQMLLAEEDELPAGAISAQDRREVIFSIQKQKLQIHVERCWSLRSKGWRDAGEKDAKNYLKRTSDTSSASSGAAGSSTTGGNTAKANARNTRQPPKDNLVWNTSALLLLGQDLGRSWKSVVREAVVMHLQQMDTTGLLRKEAATYADGIWGIGLQEGQQQEEEEEEEVLDGDPAPASASAEEKEEEVPAGAGKSTNTRSTEQSHSSSQLNSREEGGETTSIS